MLEGGEDIKFIARRMIILASEDIGNANPTALVMANCFQSINVIGMPEARIILSQTAIYLASSAKSNAPPIWLLIWHKKVYREQGALSVPLELRNAPTKLMKDLNYGKEYDYTHNYKNNFVKQEYMPDEIKGQTFYEPGHNDRERQIRKFLKERWNGKYNY